MHYHHLHDAISAGAADRAVSQVVSEWAMNFLVDVAVGRTDVPATRHPLGFLCFPASRDPGYGVCVHIWADDVAMAESTTSEIHAHSWDLVSYVLYGSLRNEIVDVTETRERPTHRLFEIRSDATGDVLHATPTLVHHNTRRCEHHRQGDVYTVPGGVFHTSLPAGDTATVALGRDRPGTVDLSLGGIDLADHQVRRELCDPEEARSAARAAIARVPGVRPDEEERCCPGKS
jgi:hypothetical protein